MYESISDDFVRFDELENELSEDELMNRYILRSEAMIASYFGFHILSDIQRCESVEALQHLAGTALCRIDELLPTEEIEVTECTHQMILEVPSDADGIEIANCYLEHLHQAGEIDLLNDEGLMMNLEILEWENGHF